MQRNKRHITRFERLALGGHIADAYFFLEDLELAYLQNGVKYMGNDMQYLPKLYDLCERLRNEIKDDVKRITEEKDKE
jgi:hypothetical protein